MALAGISELGDVAVLSARDFLVELVGVIAPERAGEHFHGLTVVATPDDLPALDAVILTALEKREGRMHGSQP
ncbi:MAG: hypothetical protein EXQ99_03460 [Alphaproteobacteria bacterium]|nr:hypothetical protein [Alphaproteobacteria bacterium]